MEILIDLLRKTHIMSIIEKLIDFFTSSVNRDTYGQLVCPEVQPTTPWPRISDEELTKQALGETENDSKSEIQS